MNIFYGLFLKLIERATLYFLNEVVKIKEGIDDIIDQVVTDCIFQLGRVVEEVSTWLLQEINNRQEDLGVAALSKLAYWFQGWNQFGYFSVDVALEDLDSWQTRDFVTRVLLSGGANVEKDVKSNADDSFQVV